MPWVRLWCDILNSEKVADLDDHTYRAWTYILIAAKLHDRDGELPPLKRLAYWLRQPECTITAILASLTEAGFLSETEDGHRVHDWQSWQEPKDRTTAERSRRYRRSKKSPPASPSEETETETEQSRGARDVTEIASRRDGAVTREAPAVVLPPDPEEERICRLAEDLSGDVSWAIWAAQQFKFHHPPHAIEEALRVCVNQGKWDRRLAGGVLKRLAEEGYPASKKAPLKSANSRPTWGGVAS